MFSNIPAQSDRLGHCKFFPTGQACFFKAAHRWKARQLSKLYCLWTVQVKKWIFYITSLPAQEKLWSICILPYRDMRRVINFQWLYNVGAISDNSICTTISLEIHSMQPITDFSDLTKTAPTSKRSNSLKKLQWVSGWFPENIQINGHIWKISHLLILWQKWLGINQRQMKWSLK